jgi:hypothetical protein
MGLGKKELKKNPLEEMGIFYGLYEAIVESNQDPEEAYRLKLKCPLVSDGVLDWAKPCGIFSIAGKGIFALPEKGDLVYLSFIAGQITQPIWQYGDFKKKTAPEGVEKREIAIIGEGGTKVILRKNGKVEISNEEFSLGALIEDFQNTMNNALVLTPFGSFPFDVATKTKILESIEKFKTLLK